MKGYKAFHKGLICRGKRYQENTVFKEDKARICECGMHFCPNPIDTLDYYPLVDDEGELTEFAEVEALDKCKTDKDSQKFCTKKLKIGRKLRLAEFVKACIDFATKHGNTTNDTHYIYTDIDNYKTIASSSFNAHVVQYGWDTATALSGAKSHLIHCGNGVSCAVAGSVTNVVSSGDFGALATSGSSTCIASSGRYTRIASSGYKSRCVSTGNNAIIVGSGNGTSIDMHGQDSVGVAVGAYSVIRGSLGSWITLAEWGSARWGSQNKCICVKSAQIDGEKLKPDTWYRLVDGEFTEVEIP